MSNVAVEPLTEAAAEQSRNAAADGVRLRQMATAWRECDEIVGTVKLERFPSASALGGLSGEWNALEISHEDARVITVTGRGAGRWPTTEAVMADLFDALRRRTSQ
jgi:homoserine dehydrogenase